jgi:hypothetical protein
MKQLMFNRSSLAKLFACLMLIAFVPDIAWSHAALIRNTTGQFAPRGAGAAEKSGPCGGQPRGVTPTVVNAGQQVQVTWAETIKHPGYYIISISQANDQNFVAIPGFAMIPNNAVPAPTTHTRTVTIPNTPCTACTLQLIQVMTETNPPTNYYSCADIVIQTTGAPTPTPSPTGTPGPMPPACH